MFHCSPLPKTLGRGAHYLKINNFSSSGAGKSESAKRIAKIGDLQAANARIPKAAKKKQNKQPPNQFLLRTDAVDSITILNTIMI